MMSDILKYQVGYTHSPSIGVYLRPKYRLEITYLLVFNFDQRTVWALGTVVDNAK